MSWPSKSRILKFYDSCQKMENNPGPRDTPDKAGKATDVDHKIWQEGGVQRHNFRTTVTLS